MANKVLLIAIVCVAVLVGFMLYHTLSYTTALPNQFLIEVTPDRPVDAIVGQKCVLIVNVIDNENILEGRESYGEPVSISVAVNDEVASLTYYPKKISSGRVTEIVVIPKALSADSTLTVLIQGERGGLKELKFITVNVRELTKDIEDAEAHATGLRNEFTSWIAVNHPELNITEETCWVGAHVDSVSLDTKYYLFYSSNWEMGISWREGSTHNHTTIYLRHRYEESVPSLAYELTLLDDEYYRVRPISTKNAFAEAVWR